MVTCYSSPRKPIQCTSAIGQVPQEAHSNRSLHMGSLFASALRNNTCKAMREVALGRGSDELRCARDRGLSLSGSPEAGMTFGRCLRLRPGSMTIGTCINQSWMWAVPWEGSFLQRKGPPLIVSGEMRDSVLKWGTGDASTCTEMPF